MATELHNFTGNEVIATELPSLLNQNFDYLENSRIKTVNGVEQDVNNNIDVTSLVSQLIPSGSDLNNFIEGGEYLRETDTIVVSNSPTEKPFFLTVLFAENLVKQVLTEIDSKDPMTFTRTLNGAKWSPWVEGGVDIGIWKSEEAVNVGDVRFLKGRENAGYILECVTAGTTGETQPTFTEADVEDSAILMASEEEALAGEVDDKIMSPLQVANAIKGAVFDGGSVIPITNGGTGATTAEQARENLGISAINTEATDYIIESYRNGTEWYEVYKSGKVRQGGALAVDTAAFNSAWTVTLHIAFADNKYFATGIIESTVGDNVYQFATRIESRTTTNFKSAAYSKGAYTYIWVAEGQGA